MSSGPDFHAWTHRPKAKGGTDPIELPGGITWCIAKGVATLDDAGSEYPWVFTWLYANDSTTFEPNLVGGQFVWVQINQPGYYVGKYFITGASDFPTGHDLFLEPMFEFGGVRASMPQNMDDPDFTGIRFNSPAQQLAAGPARGGLYTELAFNWDPVNSAASDFNSENPLKVGASVALAGGPATLADCVFQMWLARITDEGYVDLSP